MKKLQQKKLLSAAVTALLCTAVVAPFAASAGAQSYPTQSVTLYMRGDMEKNTKDGSEDVLKFVTNDFRLQFIGSISEETSYRVRFRPSRSLDSAGRLEKTSSAVDYVYIDHKMSDTLTLRAGKQYYAGVCGREGDYNGQDVYRYSLTCDATPAYATGFAIKPKFGDQNFTFALVNSGNEANQGGPGIAATWYGNLMGGAVKPIVSIISLSTEAQAAAGTTAAMTSSKNTYFAAGAEYTNDNLKLDVDYMTRKVGDRTVGGGTDLKGNSLVINGRLSHKNAMQPVFKFEQSSQDSGGTTGMDRTAITLGVEYFPNKGKKGANWRTHAIFTTATDSFDNGAADVKDTKIIIGFGLIFSS